MGVCATRQDGNEVMKKEREGRVDGEEAGRPGGTSSRTRRELDGAVEANGIRQEMSAHHATQAITDKANFIVRKGHVASSSRSK